MSQNLKRLLALSTLTGLILFPSQVKSHMALTGLSQSDVNDLATVVAALPPLSRDIHPPSTIPEDSNRGGGRRGCPLEESPMKAIVPESYQYGGLTHLEQPTLWIYLPFAIANDEDLEMAFRLIIKNTQTESSDTFSKVLLAPDLSHGFLGIPLSSLGVTLSAGTTYEWSVELHCDSGDIGYERPYTVSGWIARIDTSEISQPIFDTSEIVELSHTYRDQELWYDAVSLLGEALSSSSVSPGISLAWQQLLSDGGFEMITDEIPIQYLSLPME